VTDLKALMELSTKVTPLPWEWENSLWGKRRPYNLESPNGDFHPLIVLKTPEDGWPPNDADAAYIAAACNTVPSLIQRLQAAEEEREQLPDRLYWLIREIENGIPEMSAAELKEEIRSVFSPPTKSEEKR
jgi:hypothetical protein